MATTNWYSIRDSYVTTIKALTPNTRAVPKFRERPVRRQSLREWAEEAPTSDAFRRFEILRTSGGEEAPFFGPAQYEVREDLSLTVAYPSELHQLFGDEANDDLEQVIELDANQLRDAVTSAGNYASGLNVARVTSVEVEREDPVWFLVISFEVFYYKAQSLS